MKRTGAALTVYALEQIGVRYTFGIPGVHNIELYDELNNSKMITPVLVTHECGAAFMADGVSRTSNSIGTLVIVPAAGTTNAASGIGEAYLDGIPMLVISSGTRRDSGRHYQLHQIDQEKLIWGLTKAFYLVKNHEEIIPTIYRAYNLAISGEPGPVFIEIPSELLLFQGEVPYLPEYVKPNDNTILDISKIKEAADLIEKTQTGLYLGWGARDCSHLAVLLAELLEAPVSTTIQGLSVFPHNHPLHAGMGFGKSSVLSAQKPFALCETIVAIGVRFSELATGSYSFMLPMNLIHIDINPDVFNKNYITKVAICGDSTIILSALIKELNSRKIVKKNAPIRDIIKTEKEIFCKEWNSCTQKERVSPGLFFSLLRKKMADDDFLVVDDGTHTFLAVEQYPVYKSKSFISPTDFNCMGYSVPAAIGVKLSNPDRKVVTITGDGSFLMTGLELLTATTNNLGIVVCIFHDGELGQIAQFQQVPLNRKTCTILGEIKMEGIARATGATFLSMNNDNEISSVLDEAFKISKKGQPVIVDVKIDYSKKTVFSKGVVKTNLSRFPLGEKFRFIGRAISRRII